MVKPEDHNGALNDHRFCLCGDGDRADDYQINKSDCWTLSKFFNGMNDRIEDDINNHYKEE